MLALRSFIPDFGTGTIRNWERRLVRPSSPHLGFKRFLLRVVRTEPCLLPVSSSPARTGLASEQGAAGREGREWRHRRGLSAEPVSAGPAGGKPEAAAVEGGWGLGASPSEPPPGNGFVGVLPRG